jgi:hypothetical protein
VHRWTEGLCSLTYGEAAAWIQLGPGVVQFDPIRRMCLTTFQKSVIQDLCCGKFSDHTVNSFHNVQLSTNPQAARINIQGNKPSENSRRVSWFNFLLMQAEECGNCYASVLAGAPIQRCIPDRAVVRRG